MDIGKSISYIFDDPRWLTKVLVGSLLILISVLLTPILVGLLGFLILSGYGLEVLRNVRRGEQRPLPEWQDHWGEWLVLGLKLWLVTLVWSLPGILLSIPTSVFSAVADSSGSGDVGALAGLIIACFSCLSVIWGILVALVSPAIYIRLAETEEVSSGFQFGEILQFTRDHIGDVIVAVIVIWVVGLIAFFAASIVGALLCIIGLAITLPAAGLFTTLVQSHLYGQIGRPRGQAMTATVPATVPPAPAEPAAEQPLEAQPEEEAAGLTEENQG